MLSNHLVMKTLKVTIREDQYANEVLTALENIPSVTVENISDEMQQAVHSMQKIIREHPKVDMEEEELQAMIQQEINNTRRQLFISAFRTS